MTSSRTSFALAGLLCLLMTVLAPAPSWAYADPAGVLVAQADTARERPGTLPAPQAVDPDAVRAEAADVAEPAVQTPLSQAEIKRRNSLAMFENVFYVFSMLLLVGGALGVTLLQSGLSRPVNAASQAINLAGLGAFASLAFLLAGYPLMVPGGAGGLAGFLPSTAQGDLAGILASPDWVSLNAARNMLSTQVVIAVLATLLVAGAVAERVRFWPLVLFGAVFAGVIYPLQAGWLLKEGWLGEAGASLAAGGPLSVHAAAGFAGLAGLLIAGARRGRFHPDGTATYLPRSSVPLSLAGASLLALGLPVLNDIAAGFFADPEYMPRAYLLLQNLSFQAIGLAAATAVVAAAVVSQIIYRRINGVALVLAGLGGVVSVNLVEIPFYSVSGITVTTVAGALVVLTVALMDLLRLDDPVGVIPVHLVCGIWGTLAAGVVSGQFGGQLLAVAAVGGFVFLSSALVWLVLKFTVGLRGSEAEELLGFDQPAPPAR
ncbi:hypothetical protein IHV25_06195 [Phaeovibrio sulfidiphilus]|uniref:Ammonium transporter AmtB-like domain-containing protein n=1 Tax=Phaeovibrio sulfidiphilus TaxID=1220600 RepID=A0A8J6YMK9_9PROT|nr:hypothetical protein [Phaeovibrio sulfidiphilus]MBE1237235.1 hypothetical protein [Phaeovibrio sulfidiphilus]